MEVWTSLAKITAIIGFLIVGSVVSAGGAPSHEHIGNRYWAPASSAFLNGFKGFASIFVQASFSFSGSELIGLAASESARPRVVRFLFIIFRFLFFKGEGMVLVSDAGVRFATGYAQSSQASLWPNYAVLCGIVAGHYTLCQPVGPPTDRGIF